jgi:hypothetical protein
MDATAQPPEHHGVAKPRVPRPDPALRRTTPSHREIGLACDDDVEQGHKVRGVHRTVAVHHRHVVGAGGFEPGVHRGAVPRTRLVDDRGAETARHVGGAVAGAVVDHDHAEAGGHLGEQGRQCWSLVSAGDNEVARDGPFGHEFNVGVQEHDAGPRILTEL